MALALSLIVGLNPVEVWRETMDNRKVLKILDKPGGNERVLILRRADGAFSYALQWRQDGEWSKIGFDVGIYDSADTAETEAMQRVAWLKAGFH
ncbi:hypothetical protein [Asticcacaulis sp. AC402]|uniref:hypothetical protein n=1 Tax=Asticcacaulis sp. AC402 TaxID=1282361 RepID=UPI0003C3C663|nr:hypothetical protein [Asticcacaulis sp. AC402]ESQ75194.1 hypothetical protein ABAC402_11025 [Asticcacaulis sp. AC402]